MFPRSDQTVRSRPNIVLHLGGPRAHLRGRLRREEQHHPLPGDYTLNILYYTILYTILYYTTLYYTT